MDEVLERGKVVGRKKQPVQLIQMKGKTNLTKKEIEQRLEEEIKTAPVESIIPSYLTEEQKVTFLEYCEALTKLEIYADLDREILAMFVVAADEFHQLTREIRKLSLSDGDTIIEDSLDARRLLGIERDRAYKMARQTASDLGLSVTSRCKLVIPKAEEKPANRFNKFLGDG